MRKGARGLALVALGLVLAASPLQARRKDRVRDSLFTLADSLHNQAYDLQDDHLYEDAKSLLLEEIGVREQLGDSVGMAGALNLTGWILNLTGEYDDALATTQRAMLVALSQVDETDTLIASIHNVFGYIYASLNQYSPSIENFNRALSIRINALGETHPRVADSRYNLGLFQFMYGGNYEAALKELPLAAEIYLKQDTLKAARCWRDIAAVQSNLGNLDAMDSAAERSLELAIAYAGEGSPELITFYGFLGQTYSGLGFEERALEYRIKALDIARVAQQKTPWLLVPSYSELASSYFELGETDKAEALADTALNMAIEVFGEDNPRVCEYYTLLGDIKLKQGDTRNGLQLMTTGVLKLRQLPRGVYPEIVAFYLGKLAAAYRDVGEYEYAVSYYQEALDVWEQSSSRSEMGRASTLDGLGMTYLKGGQTETGLAYLRSSLELKKKNAFLAPLQLAEGYSHLAKAEAEVGEDSAATDHARIAVELFEQSRLRVGSEFHRTYTEKHRQIYESYIDLLVADQRFQEAFEVIERSKLKQLKESVENLALGQEGVQEKILTSQELALKQELLAEQLLEEQSKDTTEQVPEKIDYLSQLLAETKAEFFQVVSEIKVDPDYSFTVTVDPVLFASLRQDLPKGQKLLMAYPSDNQLYLFLVCQSEYQARSVDISKDSLLFLVRECNRLCMHRGIWLLKQNRLTGWNWEADTSQFYRDEVKPLKQILTSLYDVLMAPLGPSLEDASVITFIPSGELYYLPFGALAHEEQGRMKFLCEETQWNVLTSAELLKCIQRRTDSEQHTASSFLLVGNPTGANLPAAEAETRAIKAYYPSSTLLAGDDATEQAVLSTCNQVEVLHLATHCRLSSTTPWESYIQLAPDTVSDGRWTAVEISGQEWSNMDLVTLSACETAVGTERPGLEWESIAKAFSLAMEGPPSIVATLWPVYDASTKEFMVRFYDELKKGTKAGALSASQSAMAHSDQYAHPFFWAPFMLIGEWR